MKSESLIFLLQSEVKRLKKLKGEEVSGFFFILPPETETPISQSFVGIETNRAAYYQYLGEKLREAQKSGDQGGSYIGVAGGVGRR